MPFIDIRPPARPDLWVGMSEWEEAGHGGLTPVRLPTRELELIGSADLARSARVGAGVRLAVETDASAIELQVDADEASAIDLQHRGELTARAVLRPGTNDIHFDVAGLDGPLTVWLPQRGRVELRTAALLGAKMVRPVSPGRRWITYGSSITQCAAADGPSETWPALVATEHGWAVRALGFGGQCHLDGGIARYIRDSPADLISMCVGINIWGKSTLSPRAFRPALASFIETVRDGHPETPIAVMSPIAAPPREALRNRHDLGLDDVRLAIRETVEVFSRLGDPHIRYIHGPDVLGMEDGGLISDGTHPTAEGYRVMAARLSPMLEAAFDLGESHASRAGVTS